MGLFATAQHWERLRTAQGWVLRGAHIVANPTNADGATVEAEYRQLLTDVLAHQNDPALEPLATHFYKVRRSYWRGLFCCYDVPDLPRITLAFDRHHVGRLRQLVDRLNEVGPEPDSAPADKGPPEEV